MIRSVIAGLFSLAIVPLANSADAIGLDEYRQRRGALRKSIDGAVATPIFQTSTYRTGGRDASYDAVRYSRLSNGPSHQVLHRRLALLMGAELNAAIEAMWPTVTRGEKKEVLKKAVKELQDAGEEVAPVSVTADPARDAARNAKPSPERS